MVVDQLFDTLVRNTGDLRPVPGLARTFDANDAQTVFTFHLAPGAHFDDDSPVTAADVKFTLERIARKGSTSPLAVQLESVTGYAAYHTAGTAPGLAGVETPDAATVVVRLDKPFSSFPAVLGHPGFGIVPKAAVDRLGDSFKQTPVGSGPFRRVDAPGPGRLTPAPGARACPRGPGRRDRLRRLQRTPTPPTKPSRTGPSTFRRCRPPGPPTPPSVSGGGG